MAVLGAGGHAKSVIAALRLSCRSRRILLFDDNPELQGKQVMGVPVVDLISNLSQLLVWDLRLDAFVIGIGGNLARREDLYWWMQRTDGLSKPLTVVDPTAVWYDDYIGSGTVILAGASIGPGARVEENCIINTGAIVEHDCEVGRGSHIAPGAVLLGGASVGTQVLVGANATILPGIRVGNYSTVGAGAVVDQDVPNGQTWAGVPARRLDHGRAAKPNHPPAPG